MAVHNTLALMLQDEVKKQSVAANQKLIRKMIEDSKEAYTQSALALTDASYEIANRWMIKARSLLDSLESFSCGSVGGFDNGQIDRSFVGRLEWISKKLLNESANINKITITAKRGDDVLRESELK